MTATALTVKTFPLGNEKGCAPGMRASRGTFRAAEGREEGIRAGGMMALARGPRSHPGPGPRRAERCASQESDRGGKSHLKWGDDDQ